jgi:hypothetical protein
VACGFPLSALAFQLSAFSFQRSGFSAGPLGFWLSALGSTTSALRSQRCSLLAVHLHLLGLQLFPVRNVSADDLTDRCADVIDGLAAPMCVRRIAGRTRGQLRQLQAEA